MARNGAEWTRKTHMGRVCFEEKKGKVQMGNTFPTSTLCFDGKSASGIYIPLALFPNHFPLLDPLFPTSKTISNPPLYLYIRGGNTPIALHIPL